MQNIRSGYRLPFLVWCRKSPPSSPLRRKRKFRNLRLSWTPGVRYLALMTIFFRWKPGDIWSVIDILNIHQQSDGDISPFFRLENVAISEMHAVTQHAFDYKAFVICSEICYLYFQSPILCCSWLYRHLIFVMQTTETTKWPTPTEDTYTISNFNFASGGSLPELKLHYRTLGMLQKNEEGCATNAVLIMHGTVRAEFLQA